MVKLKRVVFVGMQETSLVQYERTICDLDGG